MITSSLYAPPVEQVVRATRVPRCKGRVYAAWSKDTSPTMPCRGYAGGGSATMLAARARAVVTRSTVCMSRWAAAVRRSPMAMEAATRSTAMSAAAADWSASV